MRGVGNMGLRFGATRLRGLEVYQMQVDMVERRLDGGRG